MTARFKALNLDSSDESEGESDAPTKEALEEKATAMYMEALQHQANDQWDRAESIYQQLLESEVLSKVSGKVAFINGRIKPSLEHLKYCVYKNMGHVLVAKNHLEDGLELFKKALELDDTDQNLWYKVGLVGMKLVDLNVAISAFEVALEISPRHFPSLDNMISATYAQGGLLSCLHYISRALEYNPKFKKGLALKDRIFKDHPSLKEHYVLFNPYPDYKLDPEEVSGLADEGWFEEVLALHNAQVPTARPASPTPAHCLPARPTTWLQLALLLSATHTQFTEEAPDLDFFRPVNLMPERQFCDVDMQVGADAEQAAADEEVDNINSDPANEGEDAEPMGVRGKRRRSSPTSLEQFMSGKRRSTRVRNTTRKEEPTLARTLTSLLPPSLLLQPEDGKKENEVVRWNEDSMDTMDMYRLFENKETGEMRELELINSLSDEEKAKLIKEEGYFGSSKESIELNAFLEKNTGQDILAVVETCIMQLSGKWQLHWPTSLPALYVQLYKIYLLNNPPTMNIPSLLRSEEEGAACVLFGELLLDQWLQQGKHRGKPSPLVGSCMGGEFPSLLLGDLIDLSAGGSAVFAVRCLWLHALLSLHADDINTAVCKLSNMQNSNNLEKIDIRLVNMTHHFILNRTTVEAMLSTLNRKQMVDELTDLYQQDDCEQIVAILTEVLQPGRMSTTLFTSTLERDAQYSLLLYTLWRLDRVNECMQWAERFVHESVTQMLAAVAEDNGELRAKWLSVVNNTILCILTCIKHCGVNVLDMLEADKMPRLVQSLNHVICRQIESGQIPDEQFNIISPWMLLYEIVSHCEQSHPGETRPGATAEERLPSSIRLLFTAHDCLGRRAWCCVDEAVILYQTLYQLQILMDLYFPESEEYLVLSQQLEQTVYCLYGHPMKRNKPRYVVEHNVDGLALTWARSHQLLCLLRPKELPTYDSAPKCSISADTEALLRRIVELVPPENNPKRLVDHMTKYIEGVESTIPQNENPFPNEMADIYYLIADHHFKNKTWTKAITYYILDVCNNSERVDSWACLALARGSILETKLNSCDVLKSEQDFIKKAMNSCRCYKTALDLDSGLPTLWIEYGSFSYMVHSFCNRLLKQEEKLNLDMYNFLEANKEEMIQAAFKSFTSANKLWYTEDGQEMQDERWLHHYMLGKIAEKKQEPASVYLSHYLKSMEFLHLNNAMYPTQVCYNSPQLLAVEALELYYRIHAVILKILEQSEDKPLDPSLRRLFRETLDKVAVGPFARKVTRAEETEGINAVKKTIYIDSEETRMAAVRRLMDSVIELVEAELEFDDTTEETTSAKREAEPISKPAKRIKREDSEASEKSKDGKKSNKSSNRNSTESSSGSDSDSESSSSGSTSSTSSVDSDSSEEEHESGIDEKKSEKKESEKDRGDWEKEQESLRAACLAGVEECARRFREHYKSLFRLANHHFHSRLHRDVDRARQLLLGEKGLFADRKNSNFFNNVWRIPSNEIDRPGSFAAHMSRCVHLLVEVLRECRDHKTLFDLALRLRDTPESDKKYLRDPEREDLCNEALSLCLKALKSKVADAKQGGPEEMKTVLLDAFKTYKRCSKSWEQRQTWFSAVLSDAYNQLKTEEGGGSVDAAIKFCTQELATQKAAAAAIAAASASASASASSPALAPPTTFSSPDVSQTSSPVPLLPPIPAQPKPPAMPAAPVRRGRGRPSTSSLRHQSPTSFKQAARNNAQVEELAKLYRNMVTMQMMNQSPATSTSQLLNQQQMAMALKQQINYQAEIYRQQLIIQQKAQQMQALQQLSSLNTSVQPQLKADSVSSKANALLAPSKAAVFSSQSILLPNQQSSKQPTKQQFTPSSNSTTQGYQHAMQPRYIPNKPSPTSKQAPKPSSSSPFQQKIALDPKVSLQHKLLSAKMAKSQTSATVKPVRAQPSTNVSLDKSKQLRDKKTSQSSSSLATAALISRGVTITPAVPTNRPVEVNIPKDINIGRNLSISPVNTTMSKNKSSMSPSTSKEVTVTLMKSQSDAKSSKTASPLSVSVFDKKKSQLSPGGALQSPNPLRVGSAITITAAKPDKGVQPVAKTIPKADFSILLTKPNEDNKKKDKSDVIVID